MMQRPRQDLSHCSVWRLTDGERQHCPKHALLLRSIPSILIYNFSFQYTRWGAISPEGCVPVLMLRTDCSLFALRYAHSSRLLPPGSGTWYRWKSTRTTLDEVHLLDVRWLQRHGYLQRWGRGVLTWH